MLNLLTLPPKLLARALDDLHAIAELARRSDELVAYADARVERVTDDLGALRAAVTPLDRRLRTVERQLAALSETVAPVAGLPEMRAELLPLNDRLGDVRQATDDLEPMLTDVAAAVRELAPRVAEIQTAVAPLRDVIDNLPKFMRD